jgi:hypothetical protein
MDVTIVTYHGTPVTYNHKNEAGLQKHFRQPCKGSAADPAKSVNYNCKNDQDIARKHVAKSDNSATVANYNHKK